MSRVLYALALLLALPATALGADVPPPQSTLALPTDQVWAIVAGALVPLATYALNRAGPWASEEFKAVVHVVVAAVAGGIVQAITAGGVGLNATTLQFVVTAVTAALGAHSVLWRPSGINVKLGGGQNALKHPTS